jgi:hypothetical protein
MKIVLKTFRPPANTTTTAFSQQWDEGLKNMTQDEVYKKEQIALAEEHFR